MALAYEQCNAEQQRGWTAGAEWFLNCEDRTVDTEAAVSYSLFQQFPGCTDAFHCGAMLGIRAENGGTL